MYVLDTATELSSAAGQYMPDCTGGGGVGLQHLHILSVVCVVVSASVATWLTAVMNRAMNAIGMRIRLID